MDYSLYIHIPFCSVQCTYCAFNVYTRQEALIPNYVAALCREIGWVGQSSAPPIHTIYLGGGTPSLLTPEQIAQILDTCRRAFQVRPNAEITLEANPGGLTVDYFRALRASGVNRISIGMQSTHADELRMFARPHGFDAVAETVAAARAAGHSTVSLDLIYGVPHQTLAMWQSSVSAALFLQRFVAPGTPWAHLDTYAWNDTMRPGRPEGGEALGLRALFSAVAGLHAGTATNMQ